MSIFNFNSSKKISNICPHKFFRSYLLRRANIKPITSLTNLKKVKFMSTVKLESISRFNIRSFNILLLLLFLSCFIWILWKPCKLRVPYERYMSLSMMMTTLYTPGLREEICKIIKMYLSKRRRNLPDHLHSK